MQIDVLTIFPDFFCEVFDFGIIRRARIAGLVEIAAHDLREFTRDKHRMADDRPFGGGDGMVLKAEPIFEAIEKLTGAARREELSAGQRVVLLTPQGKIFKQATATELVAAEIEQLVFICGRYEGVDERVTQTLVTDEISIGDYVLSGGEPAALVVIDALIRLIPGALGSATSAINDSFSGVDGLLDCPHYTRPEEFRGLRVPEVLLSGNHAAIERWRCEQSLAKTKENRPDLLKEL